MQASFSLKASFGSVSGVQLDFRGKKKNPSNAKKVGCGFCGLFRGYRPKNVLTVTRLSPSDGTPFNRQIELNT